MSTLISPDVIWPVVTGVGIGFTLCAYVVNRVHTFQVKKMKSLAKFARESQQPSTTSWQRLIEALDKQYAADELTVITSGMCTVYGNPIDRDWAEQVLSIPELGWALASKNFPGQTAIDVFHHLESEIVELRDALTHYYKAIQTNLKDPKLAPMDVEQARIDTLYECADVMLLCQRICQHLDADPNQIMLDKFRIVQKYRYSEGVRIRDNTVKISTVDSDTGTRV